MIPLNSNLDPRPPQNGGPDEGEVLRCAVCGSNAGIKEQTQVRCNVRKFRDRLFLVKRCGACGSLLCEKVPDLASYYAGYPVRNQKLDYIIKRYYGVVLRRLIKAGLRKTDRILDYGCNQGLFLHYLQERGYRELSGYDPYVDRYASPTVLAQKYDVVVSLDVLEHDEDPAGFLARLKGLLKSGGLLCLETPNASGIDLSRPEVFLHALHVPYHVNILSLSALKDLAQKAGFSPVATTTRWYLDTPWPATSRRFFEAYMALAGNDIDLGYEPPRYSLFIRNPGLIALLFLGYFPKNKKTDHMMMIFR